MKIRLLLLTLFALAGSAAAQFTTVTGTVTDPNGIPYAFGTITPTLSYSGGTPMLNSVPYMQPSQAVNLDKNGSFTMTLADNTVLTPASTKWNFTVCSGAGTVQPAIGAGPVCFSLASPITISGSSQSISSNLNAAAVALTNAATSTGTNAANSGSAGAMATYLAASGSRAVSADQNLIDASNTLTYSGSGGITVSTGPVVATVGPFEGPAGTATSPTYASAAQPTAGLSFPSGGITLNAITGQTYNLKINNVAEVGIDNLNTYIKRLCDMVSFTNCIDFNTSGIITVNGSAGPIFHVTNNAVRVGTSDFTTAANTNLQTITGLSWTTPAVSGNYSFACDIMYSQATGNAAVAFGIQAATNSPTNINATGTMQTNTTAFTGGSLNGLNTTTATAIVSATPAATATIFNAHLGGSIEMSALANTFNIMVSTATSGDAVTVKRGSTCELF